MLLCGFGVIGVGIELLNGTFQSWIHVWMCCIHFYSIFGRAWRVIGCMRGSSWPVLADLNPILGTFGWSGPPILGTLGASVGQVRGLAGGFWRPGGKYGDVVEKQKFMEKHRKNARNLAKYWTVLCAGGSKIWGWAAAVVHASSNPGVRWANIARDRAIMMLEGAKIWGWAAAGAALKLNLGIRWANKGRDRPNIGPLNSLSRSDRCGRSWAAKRLWINLGLLRQYLLRRNLPEPDLIHICTGTFCTLRNLALPGTWCWSCTGLHRSCSGLKTPQQSVSIGEKWKKVEVDIHLILLQVEPQVWPLASFRELHGMSQVQHRHVTHRDELHVLQVIIACKKIWEEHLSKMWLFWGCFDIFRYFLSTVSTVLQLDLWMSGQGTHGQFMSEHLLQDKSVYQRFNQLIHRAAWVSSTSCWFRESARDCRADFTISTGALCSSVGSTSVSVGASHVVCSSPCCESQPSIPIRPKLWLQQGLRKHLKRRITVAAWVCCAKAKKPFEWWLFCQAAVKTNPATIKYDGPEQRSFKMMNGCLSNSKITWF